MKEKKQVKNPYATMQAGKIEAPHKSEGEPKASRKTGTDLRVKK